MEVTPTCPQSPSGRDTTRGPPLSPDQIPFPSRYPYLAQRATLDAVDLAEVQGCRRAHNQLGFAYQVGFVRLLNRFTAWGTPLQRFTKEIDPECRAGARIPRNGGVGGEH